MSHLKANNSKEAFKTLHRQYHFKIKPLKETLMALLISSSYSGDETQVIRLNKIIKQRGFIDTCSAVAKMNARLIKKDYEGVISEYEAAYENGEHIQYIKTCELLTKALAEREDALSIDSYLYNNHNITKPLKVSIPIVRALGVRLLTTNNGIDTINHILTTESNVVCKPKITVSDWNCIAKSLIYAYDFATKTWPRTEIPNEKKYFEKVGILLKKIINHCSTTSIDFDLNTSVYFFIIRTRSGQYQHALRYYLKLSELGWIPSYPNDKQLLRRLFIGLVHSPSAIIRCMKTFVREKHKLPVSITSIDPISKRTIATDWLLEKTNLTTEKIEVNAQPTSPYYARYQRPKTIYKQSKYETTTSSNLNTQKERLRRIKKRKVIINQLKKRQDKVEKTLNQTTQKECEITFKVINYINNIIVKNSTESKYFYKHEWYLTEVLDGIPQSVEDSASYSIVRNDPSADTETYDSQLTTADRMKTHWGVFPDVDAMSKALAVIKDELRVAAHDFSDRKDVTQLPDVITSTERYSIKKRIRHLELQQELDVCGKFDIFDFLSFLFNIQITKKNKLYTEVELAIDLASFLSFNGYSITCRDFLIFIFLVENECLFDMRLRFICLLMIVQGIWWYSFENNELLSFCSILLTFFSDNCSLKKRKKILTLMRQMDL
jgi:hypothetical protein